MAIDGKPGPSTVLAKKNAVEMGFGLTRNDLMRIAFTNPSVRMMECQVVDGWMVSNSGQPKISLCIRPISYCRAVMANHGTIDY